MPKVTRKMRICLALTIGVLIFIYPAYSAFYASLVYVEAKTHTEYSEGFSQSQFNAVSIGDTGDSVLKRLGEPFRRTPQRLRERLTFLDGQIVVITGEDGHIDEILKVPESEESQGLLADSRTYQDLFYRFGTPTAVATETGAEFLSYSRSDRYSHHFVRGVLMSLDEPPRVIRKSKYMFYD